MAVIVDKAGRDHQTGSVDRARRRPRQFADLDDLAVLDRDIGAEGGPARAVDNAPVLYQEVIGHLVRSFLVVPAKAGIRFAYPLSRRKPGPMCQPLVRQQHGSRPAPG